MAALVASIPPVAADSTPNDDADVNGGQGPTSAADQFTAVSEGWLAAEDAHLTSEQQTEHTSSRKRSRKWSETPPSVGVPTSGGGTGRVP